jgi:membrane protein implicated in regulation of membrane protease activity
MSEDNLGQKEKVQILLAEYASLRNESVTRGNTIPTVVSVALAALGFVIAAPGGWLEKTAFFVLLLLIVAMLGRLIHRDILKAADRLRQLEAIINERAGETLLEWETRYAASERQFFDDLWPKKWHFGPG